VKGVIMREFGPPSVLHYEDLPMPHPGPGEVLLHVGAVSVNRSFDVMVRQDGNERRPILPLVLGNDTAGVVVELGPGVDDVKVGDRMAVWRSYPCGACAYCQKGDFSGCLHKQMMGVHRWGGYAEYVAAPASVLYPLPPTLPLIDATVILRHGPTAHALAAKRANLRPGECALVMGAAGGLGTMLVQVARRLGARVIAGAGSDERVASACGLGADDGVNYRAKDLTQEVMRVTDGRGVDVVFENISDPVLWPGALASLAYDGRLVTIGAHGGGVVPLNVRHLYGRHLSVLGGVSAGMDDIQWALDEAAAGHIKAVVGATLPLEQAATAHEMLESSAVVGKIILVPPDAAV
jgi:NADPH:quinone reductase-like Zn-dependent oxidoreductase